MPSLISDVTETTLLQLRSMPDGEAAVVLGCRLRDLESQWKRSFYERGIILHEFKQRLLWKHLNDDATGQPYRSFDRWVQDSAPQSRSDCYAALKVVEELRDVPRQELENISRCNLSVLQSLSTAVRNEPEVLQAAREMPEREFIRHVQKHHPLQWIESRRRLQFNLPESAIIVIEQALEHRMRKDGLTREQTLEYWATNDLADDMEAEDGEHQD